MLDHQSPRAVHHRALVAELRHDVVRNLEQQIREGGSIKSSLFVTCEGAEIMTICSTAIIVQQRSSDILKAIALPQIIPGALGWQSREQTVPPSHLFEKNFSRVNPRRLVTRRDIREYSRTDSATRRSLAINVGGRAIDSGSVTEQRRGERLTLRCWKLASPWLETLGRSSRIRKHVEQQRIDALGPTQVVRWVSRGKRYCFHCFPQDILCCAWQDLADQNTCHTVRWLDARCQ